MYLVTSFVFITCLITKYKKKMAAILDVLSLYIMLLLDSLCLKTYVWTLYFFSGCKVMTKLELGGHFGRFKPLNNDFIRFLVSNIRSICKYLFVAQCTGKALTKNETDVPSTESPESPESAEFAEVAETVITTFVATPSSEMIIPMEGFSYGDEFSIEIATDFISDQEVVTILFNDDGKGRNNPPLQLLITQDVTGCAGSGVTSNKVFYLESKDFRTSLTYEANLNQTYTVVRNSSDVCQLTLEFKTFELQPAINRVCDHDYLEYSDHGVNIRQCGTIADDTTSKSFVKLNFLMILGNSNRVYRHHTVKIYRNLILIFRNCNLAKISSKLLLLIRH
ncbi:hypothetical protein GQR58_012091 [Nymphon striatum]|nr:hypothetical protein GQR58_012091 [Nymphon striatum]